MIDAHRNLFRMIDADQTRCRTIDAHRNPFRTIDADRIRRRTIDPWRCRLPRHKMSPV
jgi:hypothetical protein